MADLHSEFQTFHGRVALTFQKKESLRTSRDAIRDRIRRYFRDDLRVEAPNFRGQGSYAMGTIVNPLDGEFDIDDGVYLQHLDENECTNWAPDTVHHWLVKATEGHTNEKPIDKRTCVRVRYAGQYHVDLPVYAKFNGGYMLAEKGARGWHYSDPKSVIDWFNGHVNQHGQQLRRMVRYLKAWADFPGRKGKMPSGLILTVLAAQNFHSNKRDDVSLAETARTISDTANLVFCVYNPVDGEEQLTVRLTDDQKARFQEAVSDLASDAFGAIETDDREEASKIWRKEFGDRFPAIEEDDKVDQKKEDAAKLVTVYVKKNPMKPWGYL